MSEKQHDFTAPIRIKLTLLRENGPEVPRYIRNPDDASRYADVLRDSDRERFAAILLNTQNCVIGLHECSSGNLNSTIVDPATVFKAALVANAAAVVLIHNHPSGNPVPSAEDVKVTQSVITAGKMIGIRVLDHIVLGSEGKFQSLNESGLLEFC